LPEKDRKLIMESMVNLVVQYMIVLWGETMIKNQKKVEKVIRSMARLVTGKMKYNSITKEFSDLEGLYPKLWYSC